MKVKDVLFLIALDTFVSAAKGEKTFLDELTTATKQEALNDIEKLMNTKGSQMIDEWSAKNSRKIVKWLKKYLVPYLNSLGQ